MVGLGRGWVDRGNHCGTHYTPLHSSSHGILWRAGPSRSQKGIDGPNLYISDKQVKRIHPCKIISFLGPTKLRRPGWTISLFPFPFVFSAARTVGRRQRWSVVNPSLAHARPHRYSAWPYAGRKPCHPPSKPASTVTKRPIEHPSAN